MGHAVLTSINILRPTIHAKLSWQSLRSGALLLSTGEQIALGHLVSNLLTIALRASLDLGKLQMLSLWPNNMLLLTCWYATWCKGVLHSVSKEISLMQFCILAFNRSHQCVPTSSARSISFSRISLTYYSIGTLSPSSCGFASDGENILPSNY